MFWEVSTPDLRIGVNIVMRIWYGQRLSVRSSTKFCLHKLGSELISVGRNRHI